MNNILLRRDTDEAVGLLIDYDYAEMLLLENPPESASDADAVASGSESLSEVHGSNIKPYRTVSFYLFC